MSSEQVNILLVDDRPDGLLTLEVVLKSPDYNLITASSGMEALARLRENEFAVVLLDVQMPGMDGFETADKIKEIPQAQNTPVIFVTAINKDPFYIYQGYSAGAVDYIFKPFDPKIVQSKVRVFVNLFRQQCHIKKQTEEIQIKERELSQVRKLEAIGRLAGGVAHDFNNLVTGILGLSHDLRNSLGTLDARREDLDEIIKAGNRALTLTKQLLAFGRRQVTSPKILDLNAVISDMVKMLKRLISEDIELRTDLFPELGTIEMEPSQVEQMVLNLVLNARDAMSSGGTIMIATSNVTVTQEDPLSAIRLKVGHYSVLRVTDTGCGMDPQMLSHIFEPYYTTKELDRGTGLGLATVYGIIKQAGGHIDVESAPNKGASFKVYIPIVKGIPENRSTEPIQEPSCGGTETVLVVEDEDIVRRVAKRALAKNGYTVFAARDAKEALEFINNYGAGIDLLLTDVVMPGMNGPQLAEVVSQKRPGIAVLYMSGYSEDVVMKRGTINAQTAFIEKSFTAQQLSRKAREVIDSHKATLFSAK